jgi:heme/copper-type cytochrome/quinol oxidase subunit 2
VTLRSGRRVQQAEATITFPAQPGTSAAPVQAKPKAVTGTTKGRLSLLLALLLLLLVLALLLWLLWRRRKKDEEEDEEEAGIDQD